MSGKNFVLIINNEEILDIRQYILSHYLTDNAMNTSKRDFTFKCLKFIKIYKIKWRHYMTALHYPYEKYDIYRSEYKV